MTIKLTTPALLLAITFTFAVLPLTSMLATTRYVRPTASGTGTGLSWANASADLQAMINLSVSGDEVWVAQGTYKPTQDIFGSSTPTDARDKTFYLKDGVNIYGGFLDTGTPTFASRDPNTHVTTLNGDIDNNNILDVGNVYHVVVAVNNILTTVLEGFTISGGYANDANKNVTTNTVPTKNILGNAGGGLFYTYCSVETVLNNCTISGNYALFGGGITLIHSSFTTTNCTFVNNTASQNGAGIGAYYSDAPIISNCTFTGNTAAETGGGIAHYHTATVVTNCTFYGNVATSGSGISNTDGLQPVLKNCIIWGNTGSSINNLGDPVLVSYTIVAGGYSGTGNQSFNPRFFNTANLIGTDNKWRTADDGLSLQQCSPANNTGDNTGVAAADITGATRIQQTTIDLGAYESAFTIPPLSTTTESVTQDVSFGNYTNNTCSNLLATVMPSGVSPVSGTTTVSVFMESGLINSPVPPYVSANRHYEIVPTTNAATATGTIKLYFTQTEFTAFNSDPNSTYDLPTGTSDATGKANLRIFKFAGTATGSHLPANYTGAMTIIDPDDANIIWNAIQNHWEVTFDVTGFSGFFIGTPVPAVTTRYVRPTASGTGTGLSWDNASADLQTMINLSEAGNEIWVAQGTYKPTRDIFANSAPTDARDKTFYLKDGVNIYGGFADTGTPTFASRNPTTNITILNGDIDNNTILDAGNAYHVVVASGNTLTTVLEGFTISGGYANDGNKSLATNTVPSNNILGNAGGGIFYAACSAATVLNNCTISGNYALFGGGMTFIHSSCTVTNATILNNTAAQNGGGIGSYYGESPIINNCTFIGNSAIQTGGGISHFHTASTITNCTFYGNSAALGSGIANTDGLQPVIKNCILWGNTGAPIDNVGEHVILTYSIVEGEYPESTGKLDVDPLFFNTANLIGADNKWRTADDGLTLKQCSPAINAGNNTGGTTTDITGATRVQQTTIDLGAYETLFTALLITTDAPTAVTSSGATLNATINVGGVATTVNFQYGTDPANLNLTTANQTFSGSTDETVTEALAIPANTLYYYRVKLVQPNCGTFYGAIKTINCVSASTALSSVTTSRVQNVSFGFFGANTCTSLIAKITPSGANPVAGTVTAAVFVENNPITSPIMPYLSVKRHYELTPATEQATATGTITLYFTQAELTAFNSHPSSTADLPSGASDAAGIANVRIFKYSGTPTGGNLPTNYSGALTIIDPVDANIVWSATNSRWEITFDVTGFSGFFLGTNSTVLSVELAKFEGHTEGSKNVLNWATVSESNTQDFDIQRLIKDNTFETIGTVKALGKAADYQLIDNSPLNELTYYRLKINDKDGKTTFSKTISLENASILRGIKIYPNPVSNVLTVENTTSADVINRINTINRTNTIEIINTIGQVLIKTSMDKTTTIDVSSLPKGVYFVQTGIERVKFVKM